MNIKLQKDIGLNDHGYRWYSAVYATLYYTAKAGKYKWDDFAEVLVNTDEFKNLYKLYKRVKHCIILDPRRYNAINMAITDFLLTDIEKDIIANGEEDIARSGMSPLHLTIRDFRKNNGPENTSWISYHRMLFTIIVKELVNLYEQEKHPFQTQLAI